MNDEVDGHPELSATRDGVLLRLHVQPGTGRSSVVGRHGEALKLRIAAPPVDNRANEEVVRFVADRFGVHRDAVTISAGGTGRRKQVRLEGITVVEAARIVEDLLTSPRDHRHR